RKSISSCNKPVSAVDATPSGVLPNNLLRVSLWRRARRCLVSRSDPLTVLSTTPSPSESGVNGRWFENRQWLIGWDFGETQSLASSQNLPESRFSQHREN